MKKVIHTAETRGFFDHGWLRTYHTFSFAKYNDPKRINFGALRVLNDDTIIAAKGFSKHPQDNMEIITIPLSGALIHEDSANNKQIIKAGDVQILSAGTGIVHSEFNKSQTDELNIIQLWIFPDDDGYEPGYSYKSFDPDDRQNKIQTIISPFKNDDILQINQNAFISWTRLSKNFSVSYKLNDPQNGLYLFLTDGSVFVENEPLQKRDGMGLWETSEIKLDSIAQSEVLLIEVPLNHK
jgi:hypothetical protein